MIKPELTERHKEVLLRSAYASQLSPVGAFLLVGDAHGDSRFIPHPGDVPEDELNATIAAAFAEPELPLDQVKTLLRAVH